MEPYKCPCTRFPAGGGMSCIVLRRRYGDWVHEDEVLLAAGLPVREHCLSDPTPEQLIAMNNAMIGYDSFARMGEE